MNKTPNHDGKVLELYISKAGARESREQISVDALGVIDDKFYAKEPSRSVLLSSTDSYSMAKESGIDLPRGSLGENILLNYNPYSIPIGTEFRIGEVVLIITQNCTLCKSLTKVDNRLPKLLKDDRGIFAKVIQGGTIKIGDSLKMNDRRENEQ